VRDAIHAFKFGGRRALAGPLGDLLAESGGRIPPGPSIDLVIAVPLHPSRERQRGFNQATLLARRLGRRWELPVAHDVIRRATATTPQTELDAEARRENVRNAFVLRRPAAVAGRHVLLVDDIMTTGATVGECAACLRRAGAASVGVLTVARVT
jgi:ComF family protein